MYNLRFNPIVSILVACSILLTALPMQAASLENGIMSSIPTAESDAQVSEIQIFLPVVNGTNTALAAEIAAMEEQAGSLERLISEIENHLSLTEDGTISTSYVQAASASALDMETYVFLMKSLDATNEQLRSGILDIDEVNLSSDVEPDESAVMAAGFWNCSGLSGAQYFWWGRKDYLNSCESNQFIAFWTTVAAGMTTCAAISAVFAAAPVTFYCGLMAGASGFGVGVLQWYASPGNGIIMHIAGWDPAGVLFRIQSQ